MPYRPGLLRRASQALLTTLTAPEKRLYASGVLNPAGLTLPDFLGIGAQKAGTSWLYANLRRHPQIFLPEQKELHFWDRRYHRSLHYYAAKFRGGRGLVKGEITPAYSILPPERIAFIRRLLPELRLVLLLRNPVERAWSNAVMALVKRGGRPLETLTDDDFIRQFRRANSINKGSYSRILERWLLFYPREQLLVGYFEELRQEPENLLMRIFDFLGVDRPASLEEFPVRQRINVNPPAPLPDHLRQELRKLYQEELQNLYQILGEPVRPWLP